MSPPDRRPLVLCADDFGLSEDISAVIADLAQRRRLSAISCMAVMGGWARDARRLEGLGAEVAIGLHLVLSDERPLGRMPRLAPAGRMPGVDPLTQAALLGQAPLDEIADEIHRQFDAFQAARGAAPDFVDGHQHVHMLPGVRRLVLAITQRRAPRAWIRSCTDRPDAVLARPFPLRALRSGGLSFNLRRDALKAGLRTNLGFAGYYDFRADYAKLFPRFLVSPGPAHLVMCHPGAGRAPGDSIAEARIGETRFLGSTAFERALEQAGLRLSPYAPGALAAEPATAYPDGLAVGPL